MLGSTNKIITGLEADTDYVITVQPFSSRFNGPQSEPVRVTTLNQGMCTPLKVYQVMNQCWLLPSIIVCLPHSRYIRLRTSVGYYPQSRYVYPTQGIIGYEPVWVTTLNHGMCTPFKVYQVMNQCRLLPSIIDSVPHSRYTRLWPSLLLPSIKVCAHDFFFLQEYTITLCGNHTTVFLTRQYRHGIAVEIAFLASSSVCFRVLYYLGLVLLEMGFVKSILGPVLCMIGFKARSRLKS